MPYSYEIYTADGVIGYYTIPCDYLSKAHINVQVDGEDVDFEVTDTYQVTLTSVPALNSSVRVERLTPIDEAIVDYQDGSTLLADDLDASTLQNIYITQENADKAAGQLNENAFGDLDADNRKVVNLSNPENAQDAATKTYVDTRFTADKVAVDADKTAAQTARTGSENARDAAQSSASSASDDADATAADRVQTGFDRVATGEDAVSTNADAIATAADRVQTGLDRAATNADVVSTGEDATATAADRVQTGLDRTATETARDTAEGHASDAASALSSTQAARDATLAAFDNFDDRYLGDKAADPTVDNDGDALVAGSLYFNTSTGAMKVYTGTIWVAAYVSGTDFLAIANNLSDLNSPSTARANLGLQALAQLNQAGTSEIENDAVTLQKMEHGTSGDLLYYGASGEPLRLAKGTDGQGLKLSSGLPVWEDAGGGGGGWVPIQTQTVSSAVASVDFTSGIDGTYKAYAVVMSNVNVADGQNFLLRTSANSGASFDEGASDYQWAHLGYDAGGSTQNSGDNADTGGTISRFVGAATGERLNGILSLHDPSATGFTSAHYEIVSFNSFSGDLTVRVGGVTRLAAASVNAIRFLMSSGNIASGTFTLYGLAGT